MLFKESTPVKISFTQLIHPPEQNMCILSCFPPSFTLSPFIFYNQWGYVSSPCPPFPKCVIYLLRTWNLGCFNITLCRFCRNTWHVCLVPKHLLCLIYPHRLSRYSDDLKLRKWEGAQLAKVWHWVWLRLKFVLQSWAQAAWAVKKAFFTSPLYPKSSEQQGFFAGDE